LVSLHGGIDGMGLDYGRRMYFILPRAPYGSMAEKPSRLRRAAWLSLRSRFADFVPSRLDFVEGILRSRSPRKGPGLGQRLGPGAQEDSKVRALARVDRDVDAGAESPDVRVGDEERAQDPSR
jgi:hypothetical protein